MIAFAVSLVVTTGGVALLLPALHRARVMDVPNARSSHSHPVPRGGGVAVVLGIVAAVAATAVRGTPVPWLLVAAALALAALGLLDDVRSLGNRVRIVVQALTAAGVVSWAMSTFGGSGLPATLFIGVGAVGLVGYVNAFNFMDGINGISALNAAVAGGWNVWLGNQYALPGLATLGLAVVGSSLGFLPWNAPEARIFLGDVGSYALGLLLGGMAVVAWSSGVPVLLCIAPFTFYLADTAWVLVKRATGHRPLTEAHREHVYQRLVDGGWTHLAAAGLTAVGAGASCVVIAIWDERPLAAGLLTAALVLAYLRTPGVTTGRPAQARVRS